MDVSAHFIPLLRLEQANSCASAHQHYFKRVRQFFRQEARREWYEYRTTVFDALCQSYSANLAGLSSDLSIVSSTQETLDSSLPFLRARAAELSAALEKEKARNESLQSADQEHLAELREAIKEQNGAMEDFRRDVKESEEQLARVQDKEDELTTRRKEQEKAIAASRKVLDEVKFYTKGEVCRLQGQPFPPCTCRRDPVLTFTCT